LKLEQEGAIASDWGRLREQPQGEVLSAHQDRSTQLEKESKHWEQATAVLARFLATEDPS
jgi:hypothetical protein